VVLRTPAECECKNRMQRIDGSAATYILMRDCPFAPCVKDITQRWTDWPECEGKLVPPTADVGASKE